MNGKVQLDGKCAEILAPAKLNLFLEILGKRSDGFHDIITVMQTITLFDTIRVTRRPSGIEVVCEAEDVPAGRENIAWTAAEKALALLGTGEGVRVEIDKVIPAGRGLGGGSSDAAAVLKAVNALWGGQIDDGRLHAAAAELGSDVPFLLKGGTALCRGRGEDVTAVETPLHMHFVVLSPPIFVPTGPLYEAGNFADMTDGDLTNTENRHTIITDSLERGDFSGVADALYNGFEEIVFRTYPGLSTYRESFIPYFEAGGLTGTGSAFFGLCTDRRTAETVAGRIPGGLGDVFVAESMQGTG